MSVISETISILESTLSVSGISEDTQLLGGLPEFDSMAVVGVLVALEEHFGFEVDDDEISAEIFENISTLVDFIKQKMD